MRIVLQVKKGEYIYRGFHLNSSRFCLPQASIFEFFQNFFMQCPIFRAILWHCFCLLFLMSRISFFIHFFFSLSIFLWDDLDCFSKCVSFRICILIFPLYLLLMLTIYFSFIFGSFKHLWHCNFGAASALNIYCI